MIIDYNGVKTFTDSLEVYDIGNCAIKCEGQYKDGKFWFYGEYYLVIKTIAGRSYIFKFGPIVPDLNTMPNGFNASYKDITYKESSLMKEITLFINDGMKQISKAEVVDMDDVLSLFPSPIETFDNI